MSAVSESGAGPGEGLEQQFIRLRELVFRRSANAAGYARELGRDVELLTARVELMSALADWNNRVDGARDQIAQTAGRLAELEPTDAQTLLDLIAALLVAGRESEALTRVLALMDPSRQDIDYAQTVMLIEYLFGGGRAAEAEKLLQRTLRHLGAGVAGLFSTTVVTVLSGRRETIAAANRRLLTELLRLVDRQLVTAPDHKPLLRIRARTLIDLGRYQDALGAVDAILGHDEGSATARWLRVIILTRLHDYKAALQEFDLLSLERASTPWALAIRTYLLQSLGRATSALEAGAEALQQYPDQLDVQLAYALAVDAAGEPERALELIGELLRGRPDDVDLLTVDGALLRRLGRLPEATAALEHAVDKNPHDVEARATLADVLAAGDDIDGAIAHLDIAISDDADRADLLLQRARILKGVNRTIEALESVDLAQSHGTGGPDVLGLRADILLQLGRGKEAAAWYERAREAAAGSSASKHYAASMEQIASDLFNSGTRFTEALDFLEPLTAAGVLSVAGMAMRAELLRLTGQYTQALEQADRAIAAGADPAWTSATKAQTLVDLSRSQEALDILDEVLAANPDYVWARFTAISAMGEVGRGSDSLAALDQYFPEDDAPEGWVTASQMTHARFFLDLGRYDEAISKLLSLSGEEDIADADRAYLHGVLGVAYNRLGGVDEAVGQLRESIKLFGDEAPKWAHVELADALARRQEQLEEATMLYRSVVTTVPPELVPRERANRAWALFRLGQVDEAIAEYQTALTAAADPLGEVRFHFVAMLHATGQPQAEAELERALATTAALPDRDQAREVLHEGRYLLDLLAHDQAHASAAEQLMRLSERLAKQDLDGIAPNRARAKGIATMPFFSKPIAKIYVKELRTRLDSFVVPIFTPDTSINVGDFGTFEDGRFVSRGNVSSRGVQLDVDQSPVNAFEYASSGKVSIAPSVDIPNPAGGKLLKTVLSFSKSQAVVASFQGGVEYRVSDADAFGQTLMELWYGKKLNKDRVVVWSLRRATGGTVIVSEEGNNQIEVIADSALLGPAGLTLAGLSVGVQFGVEQKATWKLSSSDVPLVVWARLFRLDDRHQSAVDAFGFESDPQLKAAVAGQRPAAFTADDLLGYL